MSKLSVETIRIVTIGEDQVIHFAARELQKYLSMMVKEASISEQTAREYRSFESGVLWVGLIGDFNLKNRLKVTDPQYDDAIYIDVKRGTGIISGINPRSVLLAVYRLLREAGCRWFFPGDEGEYIPELKARDICVTVSEKAAYRHRGICIEGAVSYENIARIIDWAAKNSFNAYFIQFREAFAFFERWYTHQGNESKTPEPFSLTHAREYVKRAENEIKKRGMLFHAVGHGWTCEPLGMSGLSWEPGEYNIAPEFTELLAEVNGKRAVWDGIPLNTNLCYSNPKVRELVVANIVDYLKENSNIDFLHFWLADGSNNQCECEECRKKRPSDFYVQMLNQLDQRLTELKINTKIVFLIYVDLMWPPEAERIQNPDRFVIMFAPITRTYNSPFTLKEEVPPIPPYDRNHLIFPKSVGENLAFLKEWQKQVSCDSFDFDYHLMWDHYFDPGYYKISQVLHQDIKNLHEIGLNGYISCQTQRTFFPTGLPMYIMGRTLWDAGSDYHQLVEDYFRNSFGADWKKCRKYLETVSELFDPSYLREDHPDSSEAAAKRFHNIPAFIERNHRLIERNLNLENPHQSKAWRNLLLHGEFCSRFALVLESRARKNREETLKKWDELKKFLAQNEDQIQPLFDLFEFIVTIQLMRRDFLGTKE